MKPANCVFIASEDSNLRLITATVRARLSIHVAASADSARRARDRNEYGRRTIEMCMCGDVDSSTCIGSLFPGRFYGIAVHQRNRLPAPSDR